MSRSVRQAKILELIERKEITSQEELLIELRKLDFEVNQSTISRDIRELGLIKVAAGGGRSKYAYVDFGSDQQRVAGKFLAMFKQSVLSVADSGNLIVVKTLPGSANAAGMAIDKLALPGILGSVAGDDTLLIVAAGSGDVAQILEALNGLLHG